LGTSDAACVYCRHQPVDPAWRPFCSERCKMADLGRWLTGGYNIPVVEDFPDEDVEPVPGQDDEAS
jgi:uncharacterized protein